MNEDSRTVLRWDWSRKAWRQMNYICFDGSSRGATPYWLAKCDSCGEQGLFHYGRGTCPPCRRQKQEAVMKIAGRAHRIVRHAIMQGDLARLDGSIACVDCGKSADVYDHREYARPLDVDPVCIPCNYRRGPAKDIMAGLCSNDSSQEKTRNWCNECSLRCTPIVARRGKTRNSV